MKFCAVLLFFLGSVFSAFSQEESPAETGQILRNLLLASKAAQFGFSSDASFPKVWGLVTEWQINGQVVTIVALRDGTASLYTDGSFGIVGGKKDTGPRQAAEAAAKLAADYLIPAKESSAPFASPAKDEIYYYFLTYEGVFLAKTPLQEIYSGNHPSIPLFLKVQDVLAQLRRMDEKNKRDHESPAKP